MSNFRYFLSKSFLVLTVVVCLLMNRGLAQTGPCAAIIPGSPLPDLIVWGDVLQRDMNVTVERFSQNQCAVVEGCVSSRGSHQLLRFSSSTPNIGDGDLIIGDPLNCPNLFHQSECHHHLHFKEYSDYRLWTLNGYNSWVSTAGRILNEPTNTGTNAMLLAAAEQRGDLIVGRKQGFCIIDTDRYPPKTGSPTPTYLSCGTETSHGFQGLSVGWADTYGQSLDCQYIQIDNLKEAVYVLEVQANPEWLLPESDHTNNSSAVQFNFTPKHGKTPARISDKLIREVH
jgi:Lysyl oxidase